MSTQVFKVMVALLLAVITPVLLRAAKSRSTSSAFKNLPILPARTLLEQRSSMMRAYDEYLRNGRMCRLAHPSHTILLLPMQLINQVKGLPEVDAGWRGELGERFVTEWTAIVPHGALLELLRGKQFHTIVNSWIPGLVKECEVVIPRTLQLDDGKEWASVRLQHFSISAVAQLVGLVAGGESLARDERWVRLA